MSFWAWSYVLSSKAYLYWVPDETGTQLMEVWPVPPWMIRPIPDKPRTSSAAMRSRQRRRRRDLIPSELITYSHSVNLFDVRDGLSLPRGRNDRRSRPTWLRRLEPEFL
jgi:hypothetical protein